MTWSSYSRPSRPWRSPFIMGQGQTKLPLRLLNEVPTRYLMVVRTCFNICRELAGSTTFRPWTPKTNANSHHDRQICQMGDRSKWDAASHLPMSSLLEPLFLLLA